MRLISQDGMIDVPYDKVVVKVTEHPFKMVISALFEREDCMKDIVMGYYSTESKALKVMEMLQKQFLDYCCNYHSQSGVFCFPKDEEVEV